MKNRITVCLPFSFKGETYSPKSTIDLDAKMHKYGSIPCLYNHLAEDNNIDIYSYEHDVMMMSEMVFEDIEGIAADFIHDGQFDTDGFEEKWWEINLHEQLEDISKRLMNVDDLASHPELKSALMEAYEAGRKEAHVKKSIRSTTDPLF